MDLDALQELDRSILLAFNGSDNLFMDSFMLTLTSAYTWIALYASLLYLVIKNNENWLKIMLVIGAVALSLTVVDGVNLGFIKPLIARPRPLEAHVLQRLVVATNHYRAEGYSFFSSHAANAFVVAVFFSLLVRDRICLYDSMEHHPFGHTSLSRRTLPLRYTRRNAVRSGRRSTRLLFVPPYLHQMQRQTALYLYKIHADRLQFR